MRLTQFFLPTLREPPSDADTVSAKLMFRSGMIRKVASGIYEWLPLGLRALRKVESIVRREMDAIGGLEVWLPVVQPKELWMETGRWQVYGKELLRFKDRKESEFCLSPTAEEVVTDLVRNEVSSHRSLPLLLYQFATKFRDEIRPRFGVMRAREFYMKDAYSFHADDAEAEKGYRRVFDAYTRVFDRCGLKFRPVEAESGPIGGSFSHEFMVLAETGEDGIASCEGCGYAANLDRAECHADSATPPSEKPEPLQEVPTPQAWTVEDVAKLLAAPKERFLKTMFYKADGKPVVALVRGDHELNESKLLRHLKAQELSRATDEEYRKVAGCDVGFAGPVGLKGCPIVADHAIRGIANGISGANKKDTHLKNINLGRDFSPDGFADLHRARPGDGCLRCGKPLKFSRGIEVGHTFKLGAKYSEAMKATFLDPEQKSRPMVMGCYGIGISRVVAAAIEQNNDGSGILWPEPLAPFRVYLIPVEHQDPAVRTAAETLYEELGSLGVETLLDDREARPGVKFKDADLIGIPFRATVSTKTLAQGSVEIKARSSTAMNLVPLAQAAQTLCAQTGTRPGP